MNDFAAHTSEVLRKLRESGERVLVTRRHVDPIVAITPTPKGVRHAIEVPIRRLSRHTYEVLEEVRKRGQAATITRHGAAVAVLRPVNEAKARRFAAEMAAQSRQFIADLERADEALVAGRAITVDDELIDSLPKDRPNPRRAKATARRRASQPRTKARKAGSARQRAARS